MKEKTINKLPLEDNIDVIRSYFIAGGMGIELTGFQIKLKDKIIFADETIRQKTGLLSRDMIAAFIGAKFNCSKSTAYTYMRHAENIFSSSNPLNKKYLIGLRIDFCFIQQSKCLKNNDHEMAHAWEKMAQKYIETYPDTAKETSKRTQIFILPVAVKNEMLTEDAAFEIIDKELLNGGE